jgi:hypothetical protein
MKIYVTARFKGLENKADIEALCAAVRHAGHQDYCFIRDVEHYQKVFNTPKEVWDRTKLELKTCEALLIDISDNPSGGRVIEAGMAFALDMPIYVAVHLGIDYKPVYDGIATKVITYSSLAEITAGLQQK